MEHRVYVAVSDWHSHCNHDFDRIEVSSRRKNKDIVERLEMFVKEEIMSAPEITLGSCPPPETRPDVPDAVELIVLGAPAETCPDVPDAVEEIVLGDSQRAPSPEGNPAASVLKKTIAEELEKCGSLLHHCHDVDALLETRAIVESAFRRLAEGVPHSSGLQIGGSLTNGCSSLKPLPKRKCLL